MKQKKHFGVYGILIKDNKIVLIKKKTGPYDGKLDLPGGSFEFGETPEDVLKRELLEEVGIKIKTYELIDANSVKFNWQYQNELLDWHHIGIFYKIISYEHEITRTISIDEQNDDSLGADFYEINKLKKEELSEITILELEKLGYELN